jgi:tripartite ATP-independent transporter DctM subunit
MSAFIRDNMAPLMFLGLVLFMLIGYPAAFSLAAVGLLFAFIGIELGLIEPNFLGNLTYQLFGIVSHDQGTLLLAIPFFTFMGAILERCGLAEDLLESICQLFGPVRGGLSYAVIFVGAILGAITGTVAASVIAMGVIALPVMMRHGYSTRHTMGVIAASGTITQLIPPSLVLIVLAGRSVGDMYAGAIGPSLIQVALFCIWVLIVSLVRPQDVPALPPEARTLRGWALWSKCLHGIIPSLALIFLVLGTIFYGIATPTEAGAMGAVGALLLAAVNRRLTWPLVQQGMSTTMRITAMVIYILIGARVFSLVFQGVGGKLWIEDWLSALPGGQIGFLLFVNMFIFVLAFFLDFFEIAFIVIPLLAPVAAKLGIDLVWFGVLICANIQTSFMHPPFGFALFYLRGIAPPAVKTSDIYWGAIPWLMLQVILVVILIFWPQSVTYWIDRSKGSPAGTTIEMPPPPPPPDLGPLR